MVLSEEEALPSGGSTVGATVGEVLSRGGVVLDCSFGSSFGMMKVRGV